MTDRLLMSEIQRSAQLGNIWDHQTTKKDTFWILTNLGLYIKQKQISGINNMVTTMTRSCRLPRKAT